ALEGRVAGHGPAPRVVVVGERTPYLLQAAVHLGDAGRIQVEDTDVVDGAVPSPFGAGAVVRHQDDKRGVELTQLGQEPEEAADLGIGVGQVGGEALHEAAG